MWTNIRLLFLGAVCSLFFVRADAAEVKPRCAEASRDCMIQAATSYLDGITHADGSNVLLAPNVRRTVQGGKFVTEGAEAIRKGLSGEPPMSGRSNTRFFIDATTHNVIAFTLLHVTANLGTGKPAVVHLVERFKVERGLIEEIEGIFSNEEGVSEGNSGWPDDTE